MWKRFIRLFLNWFRKMFYRYKVWQKVDLPQASYTFWENFIVLGISAVDVRFKLKGYGWKPSQETTNLIVNYPGRYDCYYRERFATEWVKFATVWSERASVQEGKVYQDTFVELGLVEEKVWEIRIKATDASKFSAWEGVIEGIVQDEPFFYDFQVRASRPPRIEVKELIRVRDIEQVGRDPVDLVRAEEISIYDIPIMSGALQEIIEDFSTVYDLVTGIEIVSLIEGIDYVEISEVFKTWTDWVNVATPKEILGVIENVYLFPYPMGIIPVDLLEVLEYSILGLDPTFLEILDEIEIEEFLKIWAEPPWHAWTPEELLEVEEYLRMLKLVEEFYYDDCSALFPPWINLSTGTGYVQMVDGTFKFWGTNSSNSGRAKRATGLNFGDYYMLEFDIKKTQEDLWTFSQIFIGSATRSNLFKIGRGLYGYFVAGVRVDDVDFSQWTKVQLIVFKEKEVEVWVNDKYYGIGNGYWLEYFQVKNGEIVIDASYGYGDVNEAYFNNIKITNLQDEYNWYFKSITGISVSEHFVYEVLEYPYVWDALSLTEFTNVFLPLLVMEESEDISLTEFLINRLEILSSVFEGVSIMEDIIWETVVPPFKDYVSIVDYLVDLYLYRDLVVEDGTTLENWTILTSAGASVIESAGTFFFDCPDESLARIEKTYGSHNLEVGVRNAIKTRLKFHPDSSYRGDWSIDLHSAGGDNENWRFGIKILFDIWSSVRRRIVVGDTSMDYNFELDEWHDWTFEILGGSGRAFCRVYKDGQWIMDGAEDYNFPPWNKLWVSAYGSGVGEGVDLWLDWLTLQSIRGDPIKGYKYSLDFDYVSVSENVEMGIV